MPTGRLGNTSSFSQSILMTAPWHGARGSLLLRALFASKITRNQAARTISLFPDPIPSSLAYPFPTRGLIRHLWSVPPCTVHQAGRASECDRRLPDALRKAPYQEAIGSLIYTSVETRRSIRFPCFWRARGNYIGRPLNASSVTSLARMSSPSPASGLH